MKKRHHQNLTYLEQSPLNHHRLDDSCIMALTGNAGITPTIFRLILQATSRARSFCWHDDFMYSSTSELEVELNFTIADVFKYRKDFSV